MITVDEQDVDRPIEAPARFVNRGFVVGIAPNEVERLLGASVPTDTLKSAFLGHPRERSGRHIHVHQRCVVSSDLAKGLKAPACAKTNLKDPAWSEPPSPEKKGSELSANLERTSTFSLASNPVRTCDLARIEGSNTRSIA
jgi:hypothetical protein